MNPLQAGAGAVAGGQEDLAAVCQLLLWEQGQLLHTCEHAHGARWERGSGDTTILNWGYDGTRGAKVMNGGDRWGHRSAQLVRLMCCRAQATGWLPS
jgi:hypothetical protein